MNKLLLATLFLFAFASVFAQNGHKSRIEADKLYKEGDFSNAEIKYKKALEKEEEYKANYNLGNTLYQQERFEEAIEAYQKALSETNDNNIKSKIYHNLGNAYFKNKKLKESVESFKQSLRLNPKDEDTRKNLSIAKQMLKQMKKQQQQQQQQQKDNKNQKDKDKNQQQQQQQQQQQKDNKDQQKQDKKDQEKKDEKDQQQQDKKDKDKKDKQQQQDKEKEKNNQDKQQQAGEEQDKGDKDKKMTKKEMEKLLKAIENDDKEIQKRVRKTTTKSKKRKKDW